MTLSTIESGVLYYCQTCVLSLYAAPVVVWLSGSTEGTVRSTGNVIIIAKKYLLCESVQEKETAFNDLRRNWMLMKGCGIMGVVSLLPFIGTYYGWKYIYVEASKYKKILNALENAKNNPSNDTETYFNQLMNDGYDTDLLKGDLIRELKSREYISPEQLDEQARQLDNTLVRTYYVFTLTHYAADKVIVGSCFGIKYGVKIVKYGCSKTKQLINYIFKRKLLKKALIFTAEKIISAGKFCSEVLSQEMQFTMNFTQSKNN